MYRFEEWTEQQQLLWQLFVYETVFQILSSLLDRLSKIVSKPGLEMSDLVGLEQSLISLLAIVTT